MNNLVICIIIVILLYIPAIFITNYFILDLFSSTKISPTLVYCSLLSIVTFMIGTGISIYSQKKNCDRINKLASIKEGFRHVIYFLIAYALVYYVSIIREPFLTIFGSGKLGYSVAQSFVIVLNSITATIINYFTSIEKSCKLTQPEIDKNLKKLDKYLDTKPIKKNVKKIEIRD
jgi:hypothetical protein